jgi:predicted Zn-dependent protease
MRSACVLFALLLTASTPPTAAPVLTAMRQELDRSLATFKSQPSPPYFLSYAITETHDARVDGAFGTITSNQDDRRRVLSTDLRVGSARFDNTHEVPGGFPMGSDRFSWTEVPLGDDVAAIRRVLWYDTDRKYKRAIEVYSEGKSNAQVAVAPEDSSPDFAIEPAVHHIDAPVEIAIDAHQWEDKIRRYTAPFAQYGDIYNGAAQLSAESETRWYVNSDGGEIQQSRVYYRLTIYAFTQADDGSILPRYESFVASTAGGLPDDSTVLRKVDRMITDLHALKNAPVLEAYTAPAILSGRASGVFFHEVFGHRIEGHRQKQEWEGQTFKGKIGEKILPDAFSVTFDPTLKKLGTVELAGSYQYDDEGVESRRVDVVKNGVFQSFLMGRSPIAGFAHSNGHGRAQSGFTPVARQSNLVVASSQPVSHDSLKAMLIALVKQQNKPYGLLFDDIEGGFTITQRTIPNAFNVIPVMVYRIYPDGRQELVRGADLIGTPLTVFSKIVAADGDTQVFNGICGAESGWVPVSASSPDILISQIEIQKKAKGSDQAPILPAPEDHQQDEVLASAMRDEMARTMSSLKLKQLDKPYFVSYTVGEHEAIQTSASYGSLLSTDAERHQRQLQVEVRVGDYALDNTNAIAMGRMGGFGVSMRNLEDGNWLPRDDNYREIRRQLWLATDAAYKEALEALAAKRAMLLNRTRTNPLPDFTHAVATHTPDATPDISIDRAAIEDLARTLSRLATTPTIYSSRVVVSAGQMRLHYMNSEGTEYVSRRPLVSISVRASTQAPDGMRLADALGFHARRFDSLPSREVLTSRVSAMIARLDSLRTAPVLDRYNGPVVFTSGAAPDIFEDIFAPALIGRRMPIVDMPQAEAMMSEMMARGGSFSDKLGGRVLPDFMRVVDDPTATSVGNSVLFGGYTVDDEGVRAQPTVVIDSGVLKTLLTTRTPVEGVDHSTGNRRGFGAAPSNLVVSATNGISDSALVQQMLALVKRRNLPYGILVRRLGASSGTEEGAMFGMMQTRTARPIRALLAAYRVYPDGRFELIRGANLTEFGTNAFKDIVAASNRPIVTTHGSIGGLPPGFARMFMAFSDEGGATAVTSYAVPSLLFDDVSLVGSRGSLPRLPASPPPT